jgi:hypothetical protein
MVKRKTMLPSANVTPMLYSIPDAMALLSCSRSLVYELITRGELDVVKIATATRITDASVKKLLATARKGLSDPVIPEEHKHKQGRRKAARRRVTSGEERAS